MKFSGKPKEPVEPVKPYPFVDFQIKQWIWGGLKIFDLELIKPQFGYTWEPKIWEYFKNNAKDITFFRDYYDEDSSCYLVLDVPKEANLFPNGLYDSQLKNYNRILKEYPEKLKKYEEDLKIWEDKKTKAEEAKKLKDIEAAKKLLRDAGEL